MASVSPSDSVSQGSGIGSEVGETALRGPGQLCDVLAAVSKLGLSESMVKDVLSKWSGAYHAYLRKYESLGSVVSSSVSSSTVSSRSSGSSHSRSAVWHKKRSLGGVSAASSVSGGWKRGLCKVKSPSDVGYCYLMMVRVECRERVVASLGVFPTFRALLAQPADAFVSEWTMSSMRVQVKDGVCHLRGAGVGFPLCQVLSQLVRLVGRTDSGSFANVVSGWNVDVVADITASVFLDSALGADEGPGLFRWRTTLYDKAGFNYLKLLQSEYREPVVSLLGSSPSVSDLTSVPRVWFLPGVFDQNALLLNADSSYTVDFENGCLPLSALSLQKVGTSVFSGQITGGSVYGLHEAESGSFGLGYAYLAWVRARSRRQLAWALGPYPRFSALLSQPAELFDEGSLESERLINVYGGLWSVSRIGSLKLARVVASMDGGAFVDYSNSSLGKKLLRTCAPRVEFGEVSLFDRVGGQQEHAWYREPGCSYLRLVNLLDVERCRAALGSYPSVQQVIDMPGAWLDHAAAVKMRLVQDAVGCCLVELANGQGLGYLAYVRSLTSSQAEEIRFQ